MLSNNGNIKIFILLCIICTFSFGVDDSENIYVFLQTGLKTWIPTIKRICLWIFWTLAIIDFTWTFSKMALTGFEFGEFLVTLIKKIIFIGIFLFLFNIDGWMQYIFKGFIQLSGDVNNKPPVTPNLIISQALSMVGVIFDSLSYKNIGESFLKVISGIIILIAFVFMAIDLLVAYVKFFLMQVVTFFALSLGGLERFKEIGLNPIMTAIKIGIEIFMLQALMGLLFTTINNAYLEISKDLSINLIMQILTTSLIFAMITKIVPSVIEAVFQGAIGDTASGSAGFKQVAAMTGAAAVGGVVGAVGAARTINAAKQLHTAEGGGGGLDMLKGIGKNIMQARSEHVRDRSGGGMNDIANRLQEKRQFAQQNSSILNGEISGNNNKINEPYHSGVGQ